MIKSILIVLAITIFQSSSFICQASLLRNSQREKFSLAEKQFEISIDSSVPAEFIPEVQQAVENVNQIAGKQIFKISKEIVGRSTAKDGENVISFISPEQKWPFGEMEMSRGSAYWSGSKVNEIDIMINGHFRFGDNPEKLTATIGNQLLRLSNTTHENVQDEFADL